MKERGEGSASIAFVHCGTVNNSTLKKSIVSEYTYLLL